MKNFAELNREERIQKVMDLRRSDVCLVLEDLTKEINVAAIIRTAEGFGIGRVCIIHTEGKKSEISRNISKGAYKWLDIQFFNSTRDCLTDLKKEGFYLIGSLVNPEAEVLWDQKLSGKIALVMGGEANGLTTEAQELVDKNLYLPMFGLTESLNVSVAAGIFLYEIIRQKENS